MDAMKIWKVCPQCHGSGIISVADGPADGGTLTEITCPNCNGVKMLLWGYSYEKSLDEVPEEPS